QHLFPLVPPAPDLETPPRRGLPPPVALPRSKRPPRPGNDSCVCLRPRPPGLDSEEEEEEEGKEIWKPPLCGLSLRLQKKLGNLLLLSPEDLEGDLGVFCMRPEIPPSLC
ncbi:E4, partial [Uncia uncia papillomavirus 1]